MIYFIQSVHGGPIKIGFTNRLHVRIEALQTSCPFELRIIGLCNGGLKRERRIHWTFRDTRSHGEWFIVSCDLLKWIKKHASQLENVGMTLSEYRETTLVKYVESLRGR